MARTRSFPTMRPPHRQSSSPAWTRRTRVQPWRQTCSRETISKIIDRVLVEIADWQNRTLDRVYPVIFIDAIVIKIRDGQVTNRPVDTAIGVTVERMDEIRTLDAGGESQRQLAVRLLCHRCHGVHHSRQHHGSRVLDCPNPVSALGDVRG